MQSIKYHLDDFFAQGSRHWKATSGPQLVWIFKHRVMMMGKIGEGIPGVEKLCTARNRKVFNNEIGSFLTLLAKFDCHRQRAISSIAFSLFSPLIHNSNMNYCFAKRVAPAIWSKIESQMQRGRQCSFQLSFTNLEDFDNEAEQQR